MGALLALSGCDDPADAGQQQLPAVPPELVGDWSGGSSDGFRSSVWSFRADGTYAQGIRGAGVVTGRFAVDGTLLTMQPAGGGGPRTLQWDIGQDGLLYLDGESYVRFR